MWVITHIHTQMKTSCFVAWKYSLFISVKYPKYVYVEQNMVVYYCNSTTQEAEAGGLHWVMCQSGLNLSYWIRYSLHFYHRNVGVNVCLCVYTLYILKCMSPYICINTYHLSVWTHTTHIHKYSLIYRNELEIYRHFIHFSKVGSMALHCK